MFHRGNIKLYVDKRLVKHNSRCLNFEDVLLNQVRNIMNYKINSKEDYEQYIKGHEVLKEAYWKDKQYLSAAINDVSIKALKQIYSNQYK